MKIYKAIRYSIQSGLLITLQMMMLGANFEVAAQAPRSAMSFESLEDIAAAGGTEELVNVTGIPVHTVVGAAAKPATMA